EEIADLREHYAMFVKAGIKTEDEFVFSQLLFRLLENKELGNRVLARVSKIVTGVFALDSTPKSRLLKAIFGEEDWRDNDANKYQTSSIAFINFAYRIVQPHDCQKQGLYFLEQLGVQTSLASDETVKRFQRQWAEFGKLKAEQAEQFNEYKRAMSGEPEQANDEFDF